MIPLDLVTSNENEKRIKAYLEENVSQVLADKINDGTPTSKDGKPLTNKKTLSGFLDYACKLAQEKARKGARYAMVDDQIVFGWAIHYFEEDEIVEKLFTLDGIEYVPEKKVSSKITPKPIQPTKKESQQATLFDMFDEEENDSNDNEEVEEEPVETEPDEEVEANPVIIESQTISPFYRQYLEYQNKYPQAIIAYRLGDFFEVFGDNAILIADKLSLTLTSRDVGLDHRIPMIGYPYHVIEVYNKKIAEIKDLIIIDNDNVTYYQKDFKQIDIETGEVKDHHDEKAAYLFSKILNLVALQ